MAAAVRRDDARVERALKRSKERRTRAGLLSDLRQHRHHEKPTERRTRRMSAARRRGRRPRPA